MSNPLLSLIAVARDQKSREGAGCRCARSQAGETRAAKRVCLGVGVLLQCLIVFAMVGGCLQAVFSVADQVDLQRLPVEFVSRYR